MSWSTPKTWLAGSPLLAAELNTHLRDNLNALKTPPSDRYDPSGYDITFNSTVWIEPDATNLTMTVVTTGGSLRINLHARVYYTGTSDLIAVNFGLDGSYVDTDINNGLGYIQMHATNVHYLLHVQHQTQALAAGSHTIKVFMHTGNGQTVHLANPHLYVREE